MWEWQLGQLQVCGLERAEDDGLPKQSLFSLWSRSIAHLWLQQEHTMQACKAPTHPRPTPTWLLLHRSTPLCRLLPT